MTAIEFLSAAENGQCVARHTLSGAGPVKNVECQENQEDTYRTSLAHKWRVYENCGDGRNLNLLQNVRCEVGT